MATRGDQRHREGEAMHVDDDGRQRDDQHHHDQDEHGGDDEIRGFSEAG